MTLDFIPYFLTNKEWYYHDGNRYQLTDQAPQEAIDSYNKMYELLSIVSNG